MNLNQPLKLRKYLYPLSWLYGLIVFVRNKLFDWKIIKSTSYDIPIICIGNVTAGGTGKTPHTEYLIRILQEKYRVGVISRGYMRKTKGFLLSTSQSTSLDIGDEPYQIKQKYPDLILAVDGDRRRGIGKMMELENKPEVIIMDDGFQHRYVKPSLSIILSNYYRPIYEDKLLPVGLLRENLSSLDRAGTVIVTKCPRDLVPLDYRIISHNMALMPYQQLMFTSFVYTHLQAVFGDKADVKELDFLHNKHILLVTGIASPAMIVEELYKYTQNIETITYKDHYNFSASDLLTISNKYNQIADNEKIILVTEKDAARLIVAEQLAEDFKSAFYSLPIQVAFSDKKSEKQFKENIFKHVKENTRNG